MATCSAASPLACRRWPPSVKRMPSGTARASPRRRTAHTALTRTSCSSTTSRLPKRRKKMTALASSFHTELGSGTCCHAIWRSRRGQSSWRRAERQHVGRLASTCLRRCLHGGEQRTRTQPSAKEFCRRRFPISWLTSRTMYFPEEYLPDADERVLYYRKSLAPHHRCAGERDL